MRCGAPPWRRARRGAPPPAVPIGVRGGAPDARAGAPARPRAGTADLAPRCGSAGRARRTPNGAKSVPGAAVPAMPRPCRVGSPGSPTEGGILVHEPGRRTDFFALWRRWAHRRVEHGARGRSGGGRPRLRRCGSTHRPAPERQRWSLPETARDTDGAAAGPRSARREVGRGGGERVSASHRQRCRSRSARERCRPTQGRCSALEPARGSHRAARGSRPTRRGLLRGSAERSRRALDWRRRGPLREPRNLPLTAPQAGRVRLGMERGRNEELAARHHYRSGTAPGRCPPARGKFSSLEPPREA